MSNHARSSGLETPSDTADDLDEPPPPPPLPSQQTFVIHGLPDQAGHDASGLNRRLHRRPLAHRRRFIAKQEEPDHHSGVGAFPFPASSTSTSAASSQGEEGGQSIVTPAHVHPTSSHPHLLLDSSYTHVQPRCRQLYQQQQSQAQGDLYDSGHGHQDTVVYSYYDSQHYHQQPRPQLQQSEGGHHQQFIPPANTSPADSRQPASIAFSIPDSASLLRHPHDPRLLQAQFQPATQSGFGFPHRDPRFPQTSPGDLVPIRFQGLDPQEPPAGFPLSGHPGPAQLFYHHHNNNNDHGVLHHSHPGVIQFPGGYPIAFMQNPELSILNAESYDDGMSGFRAPRSLPSGRPRRATGNEPVRPKKRTKAQSSDAGELDDEDKKRSRGRPRLDTTDETAKDRRRTQIRLAQRAYRNRKETAIQSLEKKVDELRKTNEEMSKEFMRLYDFAVSKGMHESTPEFGLQLQATTEKFVALARRTSEELDKDGELPTSQDNDGDAQEASPTTSHAKHSDTSCSPDVAAKPAGTMYGGLIVSHDEHTTHSIPRSQALTAVHTSSWSTDNSQSHAPHSTAAQAPLGYEIVTEPTTDNASFPFGMSFEDGLDQAGSLNLSDQPFSETLFSIVSAPSSYAYQERTFGRRLQRSTLERAYFLVSMPDPPPALLSSAFGFCMLFESKERIKERLANCLRVKEHESMFNWKFPFWNLGGGGTWFDEMDEVKYPRDGQVGGLVGNQGTAEPHRHKVDSVFGLGPWDAQTEETRDLRIDHEAAKCNMSVPGFEGDFYDADEVEWVLKQRGIVIPPAADFVTAEIDPADFSTETTAGGQAFGTGAQSSVDDMMDGLRRLEKNTLAQFARGYLGMHLKPTRASEIDLDGAQSAARTGVAPDTLRNIDPRLIGHAFGLGEEPVNRVSDAGSRKRLVTINVGVLVQEIGLKSVCLGRSPGVRPRDLNVAFWASLAV